MGRPRKPLDLHLVDGTYRAHRHASRRDPPTRAPATRQAPRHLPAPVRRAWRELLARAPAGVLRDADEVVIEAAAVAMVAYRQVSKAAETAPLTEHTPNGTRIHPLHVELRRQAATLSSLLATLGFAPAARARLKADEGDADLDAQLAHAAARLRGKHA